MAQRNSGQDATFDAIVVGSGVSGGWAAKELTEKGLKVLVLDRGPDQAHGAYRHENKALYDLEFRGGIPEAELQQDYFISRFGHIDQSNKYLYNNDRLEPFDYDGSEPFHWIRSDTVGGKSLLWGRWVFRWSDLDFDANRRDGHGLDWPIRYADVEPWYRYVEEFAGVAGSEEGLPHLPDSVFMPPHPMNVAEEWTKANLEAAYSGERKLIHGRTTNITEAKADQNRSNCQSRAQCHRGCSYGAYFSSQAVTLPAARKTGNLTLLANRVTTELIYDDALGRVTGVRAVNRRTGATETFSARMVFLCASTIGSLQILLNSTSEAHPSGLGNSSGMLGRGIMDHPFRARAWGQVPGFLDKTTFGRRPTGTYIPRFRNLDGGQHPDGFYRGYGYQGGAGRGAPSMAPGFGKDLKAGMRQLGSWGFGMTAFGECLPYDDNMVTLHPTETDRWGFPLVRFNVTFRENERMLMRDAAAQGEEMLKRAGLINVGSQAADDDQTPGRAIHEMGGARMGDDPSTSVLNGWSQSHDVPNVFVTDGAQFNSQACVNPSLTFMALTARAADRAADLLRQDLI